MGAAQEVGCDLKFALILTAAALAGLPVRADTYFLTVAGVGGEAQYDQQFTNQAKDLDKLLRNEASNKVETLSGADATKVNVEAKLRSIATQAKADDAFVLVLIGHGTFDDRDYKFALPGPDISAAELSGFLDKIQAKQLVLDLTSSSGAIIPILQKPKRAVITATKSGTEKNVVVFGRFFVDALRDAASDADKNEVITALEAFKYAEAKTLKYYENNNHLATEHALLEDVGKGDGVKDPSIENGEGSVAGRFNLMHLGSVAAIAKDPKKQELLKQKEDLEAQVDELRYQKATMDGTTYKTKLSALLLQLAQMQEELDK
jgi:hypothetical protein